MATLLASAARTASGTSAIASTHPLTDLMSAVFMLDVTAAATDAGDTLDVYIQHSVDGGTTYDDFIHFTQVLGNGGAKTHWAHWNAIAAAETEMHAPSDADLAVGVKQGPMGETWRLKWVIVDADVDGSFTFSVSASFNRRALR